MFTIEPLVVAYGPHREKSRFTYMHHAGVAIDIPYVSWLIRGQGFAALIDVGCSAADYNQHIRPVDHELVHVGQVFADVVDVKPIESHLRERGMKPSDIDLTVLTHLDWDHCMTVEPFGNGQIVVQRQEWDNTPSHEMFATSFAPAEHYERIESMNLTKLDGDYQVAEGFDLLLTPGHTHGGQSAVIKTSQGTYVIAGMCVLKENFYPTEAESEHFQVIPPGGHTDLFQSYEQMVRLKQIGGANVLPLHMTEAFEMEQIGVLTDD